MQFVSTRGGGPATLDVALIKGIADDGGLFVADALPRFKASDFDGANNIRQVARILLDPFFESSRLRVELDAILAETFSFPIPVTPLANGRAGLLELYHGPTAAFKDVGARFLAACLARLEGDETSPLTILVATSGDTGGAVAAAFDERPGMRVVVAFPDGGVSERQAQQLTCWSDNVLALRVNGVFDDCQALVKAAFVDASLSARYRFSSANSINIGRLLPQATYYADASLRHFRATGDRPGFIIPTGNLGNAFACLMAREMGLPIGPVILSTGANRVISDYLETLEWLPRASIRTLASAMDVGNPSNMERLRGLLGDAENMREHIGVRSVSDAEIRQEIRTASKEFGFAICPHTATASHTWRMLDKVSRDATHWILVATAHPAKFETIVEPQTGEKVPLPAELVDILARPCRSVEIEPTLEALTAAMETAFV